MDKALAGTASLRGRIPADGFLPRAHHELWLMGTCLNQQKSLAQDLQQCTVAIAETIGREGCFSCC